MEYFQRILLMRTAFEMFLTHETSSNDRLLMFVTQTYLFWVKKKWFINYSFKSKKRTNVFRNISIGKNVYWQCDKRYILKCITERCTIKNRKNKCRRWRFAYVYRYAEANGRKTGNRGHQGAEGERQFRGPGRFYEGNRNNDVL